MEISPDSSFSDVFWQWADNISKTGTLHSLSWIGYFNKSFLKALVLLFAGICVVILPIYVFMEAKSFFNDPSISRLVSTETKLNQTFPKITFCNPFYYSNEKLEELGFPAGTDETNNFAAFLSITSSVQVVLKNRQYVNGELDNVKDFLYTPMTELLDKFQPRLDAVMANHSWTSLLEINDRIAVSCNHFIYYCEINNKVYVWRECCAKFFDLERPLYTALGVCYETRSNVSISSNLNGPNELLFYLHVDQSRQPKISAMIGGMQAYTRYSPWYLLSETGINEVEMKNAKLLPLNAMTFVPIELTKTDRSHLLGNRLVSPTQQCNNNPEEFESRFGMPYTYSTCTSFWMDQLFGNCTALPYWRLPNVWNKALCAPQDIVRPGNLSQDMDDFNCPKDCLQTEANIERSFVGDLDTRHFAAPNSNVTRQYAAVKIYFKGVESENIVLSKDGIVDFLSTIGGFMGLTLGASIFSCMEVVAFLAQLVYMITKWARLRTRHLFKA